MASEPGLTVRHSQRHEVALPAELRIAPAHCGRVRFSPASGARGDRLSVTIVDISAGGLGLMSDVFLPRSALVEIRVADPKNPDGPPLLETTTRAQRVTMVDRRPGYLLGLAFVQRDEALTESLDRVLALAGGAKASEDAGSA